MNVLPGRADTIRGGAVFAAGLLSYALVVVTARTTPTGTGATGLPLDRIATLGLFVASMVALYYWISQPHSE